jgi:hypothetical protein
MLTIGDSLVIPAPFIDNGRDSMTGERAAIVVNSGWRKMREEGSWG